MQRTATWLALAAPFVAAVVALHGLRGDLAAVATDWHFLGEQTAALATAFAAALAAFAMTVPGYDRRILLAPALAFLAWLSTLVSASAGEWLNHGLAGLWQNGDWFCVRWILTTGAVPAVIIAVMLRRGAPMAPYAAMALGGLAATALGNFGLRLFLAEDANVVLLVWHASVLIVTALIAGAIGRHVLCWRAATGALRKRLAAG
jgi:hypothetical protein